jgi:hypothetical protein
MEMALAAALLEHKNNNQPKQVKTSGTSSFWKYKAWKDQMR